MVFWDDADLPDEIDNVKFIWHKSTNFCDFDTTKLSCPSTNAEKVDIWVTQGRCFPGLEFQKNGEVRDDGAIEMLGLKYKLEWEEKEERRSWQRKSWEPEILMNWENWCIGAKWTSKLEE